MGEAKGERVVLGRFVVLDPAICHGQPTFVGSRILVADVLEQVAMGLSWDTIVEQWRGRVPREAIAEAINLARSAFAEQVAERRPAAVAE